MFTYPNGGEVVTYPSMYIIWEEPASAHDNKDLWYEIYFTEGWTPDKEPDWLQVATVPAGSSSFLWDIPTYVSSERCRLAIRTRNARGERSPYILTADTFIIRRQHLVPPSVVSPAEGSRYQQFVPIIIDYQTAIGTSSQRGSYQIYYSSGGDENWRVIQEDVRVGSDPVYWDIRDLPPRSDYVVKIVMEDSEGNSSIPVFVRNLKLFPMNYFILDTKPPVGSIYVVDNQEFTSDRNIVVSLKAFDEATAVKSVVVQQDFNGTITAGTEQEMADMKTWYISGLTDGLRYIEALFKDYANNTVSNQDTGEFFRRYVSDNNAEISCMLAVLNGSEITLWTAFGGATPTLFKNKSSYVSLSYEATSMEMFKGFLYIAVKKDEHVGILQKLDGTTISNIYSFTAEDTMITQMKSLGNYLYFGLQNGDLYEFDGTTIALVYAFGSQIESLYTDDSMLYIGVENAEAPYIYDGTNPPVTTEVKDANIQI